MLGPATRSPMAPTGANISATIRSTAPATCSSTSIRCGRIPDIDAVGIDNYMPLSDWRDADYADAAIPMVLPDRTIRRDCERRSPAARVSTGIIRPFDGEAPRERTPRSPTARSASRGSFATRICGAGGRNRTTTASTAMEAEEPTAWAPESKPFFFTEIGCPATDKGPNQPNVFSDPKSAESMRPWFSSGGRSDLAQQRFLAAHHRHWDPEDDDFEEADNPLSTIDGRRMVDPERLYVWAWDARPFPAFPLREDRWSDHGNWHYGHWLNGRLGNPHGRRVDQRDPRRPWPAGCFGRWRGRDGARLCHRRAGFGARSDRAIGGDVRACGDRDTGRACVSR